MTAFWLTFIAGILFWLVVQYVLPYLALCLLVLLASAVNGLVTLIRVVFHAVTGRRAQEKTDATTPPGKVRPQGGSRGNIVL